MGSPPTLTPKTITNTHPIKANFYHRVYEVVSRIPYGRVTTYGAIGSFLGSKGSARMVGWALNHTKTVPYNLPAHRVVNRKGLLTGKHHFGGTRTMQELLESEGIKIVENQVVDFETLFWNPCEEEK
ncbi:MAG: cysteine methyltransferase [Bacteroidetes bacterium]|nr:MAG: cysteine methyltransferase [Bacteroidota bacterium]